MEGGGEVAVEVGEWDEEGGGDKAEVTVECFSTLIILPAVF